MKKSVAIYMMQKNEHNLLPLFVDYYGGVFGYDAIHIFDNGSNADMLPLLAVAKEKGCIINFDYDKPEDFENKGKIIGNFINKNKELFDVALPLDCDEFITLKNKNNEFLMDVDLFRSYFQSLKDGVHVVGERYLNNPYSKNSFYKPNKNKKLFFKSCSVSGLNIGFHDVCMSNGTPVFEGGSLVYFEFHNRTFNELIEKARDKMKLRINLDDIPDKYNGPGYHLHEYLKWEGELNYIDYIYKFDRFKFNGFEVSFCKLGYDYPFGELLKNNDVELFGGDDALFKKLISTSLDYCEYGCGSSTIWASKNSNVNIFSVDTSNVWIANTIGQLSNRDCDAEIIWINCGEVKEWGYPVNNQYRDKFLLYAMAPWVHGDNYDLVLIDGRFRVLCFLISLKFSRRGAKILFDDYVGRPHYHVVEKIIPRKLTCGRQCLFEVTEFSDDQREIIDAMIDKYKFVVD